MRPEFFSDPTVSGLSVDVRLTYIGLWCIADDAGWLEFDPRHLGAQLYPYESIRVRTRRLEKAHDELEASSRVVFYPCGCAQIPTLVDHQKIGGNKSFTIRDKHEKHRVHTGMDKSDGSYVGRYVVNTRAGAQDDDREKTIAAFRRQGLPVDVPA